MNLGISLVAFRELEEIKTFLEKLSGNSDLLEYFKGFELSYNLPEEVMDRLSFLKGRVISVHAPCPQTKFYPNLGSNNADILNDSLDIIKQSVRTAVAFGAKRVVLHPGYTLDIPVYTDFQKRNAAIQEIVEGEKEFVFLPGSTFSRASYSETKNYREHLETSFDNLRLALDICRGLGVELAIENLNPRLTYLYQSPEDILEAVRRIEGIGVCLDIGHLWISSLVYGVNFLDTVKRIAGTGRVITVHVHDNNSRLPDYLADEHLSPGMGIIPVDKTVEILTEMGVTDFVLEAINDAEGRGLEFLTSVLRR